MRESRCHDKWMLPQHAFEAQKERFIYHVTPLMRLHHHRRIVGSSFIARRRLLEQAASKKENFRSFAFSFLLLDCSGSDSLQSISGQSSHKFFSLNPLYRISSHNWISRLANWWIWVVMARGRVDNVWVLLWRLLIVDHISFLRKLIFDQKRLRASSHKFVLHSCRLLITSGEYEFFSLLIIINSSSTQKRSKWNWKVSGERKLSTVEAFNTFFSILFRFDRQPDPANEKKMCASWW